MTPCGSRHSGTGVPTRLEGWGARSRTSGLPRGPSHTCGKDPGTREPRLDPRHPCATERERAENTESRQGSPRRPLVPWPGPPTPHRLWPGSSAVTLSSRLARFPQGSLAGCGFPVQVLPTVGRIRPGPAARLAR